MALYTAWHAWIISLVMHDKDLTYQNMRQPDWTMLDQLLLKNHRYPNPNDTFEYVRHTIGLLHHKPLFIFKLEILFKICLAIIILKHGEMGLWLFCPIYVEPIYTKPSKTTHSVSYIWVFCSKRCSSNIDFPIYCDDSLSIMQIFSRPYWV